MLIRFSKCLKLHKNDTTKLTCLSINKKVIAIVDKQLQNMNIIITLISDRLSFDNGFGYVSHIG